MFISGMFSEYVLGHACLVCKHSLCLVNRNNSRVLLEYSVYLSIVSILLLYVLHRIPQLCT